MDDRIYPGVIPVEDRIKSLCLKWFKVENEDLKTKLPHVVMAKSLMMILIQEYKRSWSYVQIAKFLNLKDRQVEVYVPVVSSKKE